MISSFVGSCQDLAQRYEDGMAIVLHDDKPDIFLTMTCNLGVKYPPKLPLTKHHKIVLTC